MLNDIQIEAADDLKDAQKRVETLDMEIALLKRIQRHLAPESLQARHNRTRVAAREEQLATWVYYISVLERLL